ncbi:MAG: DUF5677 domain-containing protein [Candidatus Eremiobacteraeota bacterium]|nr:DUF5677 domain-containing protein [Candidatus Eremiobacteraeota bacterium]
MNNLPEGEKVIPVIRDFSDKLLVLASEIMQSGKIKWEESDHLAFMALCFAKSQEEQLKSINVLVDAGQHRDAGQISRSSVEGMCFLIWAARELDRPMLWRSFASAEESQKLREKEEHGESVSQDRKDEREQRLKIYGTMHDKRKIAEQIELQVATGVSPLEVSYNRYWYQGKAHSIADIIKCIFEKSETFYEIVYGALSGRIRS